MSEYTDRQPPSFHRSHCFSYSFDCGTAPFNETTMFHANDPTCDPNEATDPDSVQQREAATRSADDGTPNGFKWSTNEAGQPILKPLKVAIDGLAELAQLNFYDYEEDRASGLPRDHQLHKGLGKILHSLKTAQGVEALRDMNQAFLDNPDAANFGKAMDLAQARLNKVNEFIGNSFARAIMRQAEADFCTAVYWLNVHKNNMIRHQEAGNEQKLEDSLINAESSRSQMLICGQILDWAAEQEFAKRKGQGIDLWRGAKSALTRKGWSDTRKILNGAPAKKPDPEEFKRKINW